MDSTVLPGKESLCSLFSLLYPTKMLFLTFNILYDLCWNPRYLARNGFLIIRAGTDSEGELGFVVATRRDAHCLHE